MRKVALVGDKVQGTCNAHDEPRSFTGTWTEASARYNCEGKDIIRVGDKGVTDCGHNFVAETGSQLCVFGGQGLHREGDSVVVLEGGSGVTVSGSGKFMVA